MTQDEAIQKVREILNRSPLGQLTLTVEDGLEYYSYEQYIDPELWGKICTTLYHRMDLDTVCELNAALEALEDE